MPLTECANRITSQSNIGKKRTHDPENKYPFQHTSTPKTMHEHKKQQMDYLILIFI